MQGCNYIFYTPEYQYPEMPHGEMCGDLMPYYHDGIYTFMFLYKYCIYAVDTADFVNYYNFRLILRNGTPEEQDWHAATGSVCKKDNLYYFYYTGFCEGNRNKKGKYEQAILRAMSRDFIHWEKDRSFCFLPDTEHFAGRHWRDPYVFFNEEIQKYCMLVTACEKNGAIQRSGCTAVYVSDDILCWKYYDTPLCSHIYPTQECQDYFRLGDRRYLIFSTYEKQWETRYRISEKLEGPWAVPAFDDRLEGRDYYAAKTVSDGTHRYLVGWQAIRKDCSNQGRYVWGGNVVVHELIAREDGTLGTIMPKMIREEFTDLIADNAGIIVTSQDGFLCSKMFRMENVSLIHAVLRWEEGTYTAGIMFHVNGEHMENWCQLRLELTHGKIVLEHSGKTELDQFFEEERPVQFRGNEADISILTSNDTIIIYVNDTALSGRCYGMEPGMAGVFAEFGKVEAEAFQVFRGKQQNYVH